MTRKNNIVKKKIANNLDPTNKQYIDFLYQFFNELEMFFQDNTRYISRRAINVLGPRISKFVLSFTEKQEYLHLKLTIGDLQGYGTNLLLKNESIEFGLPFQLLWAGDWHKALANCQSYLDRIETDTDWRVVQQQVYKIITSTQLKSLSISAQLLEQLRLILTLLDVEPLALRFDRKIPLTDQTHKIYYPKYAAWNEGSIYELFQSKFRSVRDLFTSIQFNVLVNPGYWGLDILTIPFNEFTQLSEDYMLPNCPIGFVYGPKKEIVFGFYWIPGKSLPTNHKYKKNLIKRIHFFLNLNNFIPVSPKFDSKNPNKRFYIPDIISPDKFKGFWGRSNKQDILNQFMSPKTDSLYTPTWDLILDTASNLTEGDLDQGTLDYRDLSTIQFYNCRFKNHQLEWDSFYDDNEQAFQTLFPSRAFLTNVGYTESYSKLIIFLTTNRIKRIPKIIQILKLWLIDAIIYESVRFIIIITRIPSHKVNQSFKNEIIDFFTNVGFQCKIYVEHENNTKITTFSYFTLPESKFFNSGNKIWQLPARKLQYTQNEISKYFQDLEENENQKYLTIKNKI